jgi:uncharacterized repeat protein (TIGR03803 family)
MIVVSLILAGRSGRAQDLSVIYYFQGPDGSPQCTPVETSPGVFSGGTVYTLFSITSTGVLTTLVDFSQNTTPLGYYASAGVVEGSSGRLYGSTLVGGNAGGGSIFKSDMAGNVRVLNTNVYQSSLLTEGVDGNLYGITSIATSDFGFFRLTPEGTYTLLYDFGPGVLATQAVILANDGNFYGVTSREEPESARLFRSSIAVR